MVRSKASGVRRCCQLQFCAHHPKQFPHQPPAGPAAEDCREEAACGPPAPRPPSGRLSGLLLGCLWTPEGKAREHL